MPRCSRNTRTSPELKKLLLESHNFPTFTYTPQFVEVLGRELSLAVGREKTPEEALAQVATEFDELAREGRQAAVAPRVHGGDRTQIEREDRRFGWMLTAPGLLLLGAVIAFPVVWALFTSLFDYTLLAPGLRRFRRRWRTTRARFSDAEFRHAAWVTVAVRRGRGDPGVRARLPRRADAERHRARQERLLPDPALPAADEPGRGRADLADVPPSDARHRELPARRRSASRR